MALNPKQQRFITEYLKDLNATQAAIRAGYSEKTARAIGHRLLTKDDIKDAVQKAQDARSRRTELSADWVIHRLRKEATRTDEGASHGARVSALKLLGQHLGMFRDRVEVTGLGGDGAVIHEHRQTLTPADLAAAAALAHANGVPVRLDGGAEPVDPARPAPASASVPAAE